MLMAASVGAESGNHLEDVGNVTYIWPLAAVASASWASRSASSR